MGYFSGVIVGDGINFCQVFLGLILFCDKAPIGDTLHYTEFLFTFLT